MKFAESVYTPGAARKSDFFKDLASEAHGDGGDAHL